MGVPRVLFAWLTPPCPGSTELGVPSRDVCDVRVRSTCERTRVRGVPG